MKKRVTIIGGGAAGILAAIKLRQLNENVEIVILERQNRIARKLLTTGSGRCNLSNINVRADEYNHYKFMDKQLKDFSFDDCHKFFNTLGLYFFVDEAGRAYPYSESAKAFLDLLLYHLKQGNIIIKDSTEVRDCTKMGGRFVLDTNKGRLYSDFCIFATGGLSALNFENTSHKILESLGHKITKITPGLVPLKVAENITSLRGVRVKAQAQLINNKKIIHQSSGEIQFRDDSVSGIVILELSSFYSRLNNKQNTIIKLDLMNNLTDEEVYEFLNRKANEGFAADDLLTGLFNKMLARDIINRAKKSKGDFIKELVKQIKNYNLTIVDTYPFANAQVTVGGLDIANINESFASKVISNCYIIGEALDIDGNTGGFNLHFAWLSAIKSARDIALKL